ncbi:MAG: FAD-binding protein, partial [Actinobacteria bacterium]|nr:FAD-binding protein [Actinomycetota bacterium]
MERRGAHPVRRSAAAGPARRLDLSGPPRRRAPPVTPTQGRVYDVVVVGAGTAGLVAALRLAQEGADVLVTAKGVGATHLTGGTVDVLGYGPERVANPAEALYD